MNGFDLERFVRSVLSNSGWQVEYSADLDREAATDLLASKNGRTIRLQVTCKPLLQVLRPEDGRSRSKAAEFLRRGADPRLPAERTDVLLIVHGLDGRWESITDALTNHLEGLTISPALVYFDRSRRDGMVSSLLDALRAAGRADE
ncbi:MAG: hypothetical protein KatS3mg023_3863 [Armatimonadota bacterium]|nr:MAG: hypothetical protein KatS3mg023_3863 [Armatimonadota bacterium]